MAAIASGSATKPIGNGVPTPSACSPAAAISAAKAPAVIRSPWAKWAKRRMPKTRVTPTAPSA